MNNIGRRISDYYCGGFFGRDYDLTGAIIIAEGEEYLVIKKKNGLVAFGTFQDWQWNRNEDMTLSGGLHSLTCASEEERQKMIDEWCFNA
jgi:hypothetical protein